MGYKKRPPRPAPSVRFWKGVHKTKGCWEWAKSVTSEGYGRIWVNRKHLGTHRFSWELHNGAIPSDKLVLHHCDNRRCVRPDHLYLGTPVENSLDCVKRGRHKKRRYYEITGEPRPYKRIRRKKSNDNSPSQLTTPQGVKK